MSFNFCRTSSAVQGLLLGTSAGPATVCGASFAQGDFLGLYFTWTWRFHSSLLVICTGEPQELSQSSGVYQSYCSEGDLESMYCQLAGSPTPCMSRRKVPSSWRVPVPVGGAILESGMSSMKYRRVFFALGMVTDDRCGNDEGRL